MNFTKKFDRAFQWAGEKMGAEAKTTMSEDFKSLESEMTLRHEGMERLQKSMTTYVKWLGRRSEVFEDREKGLPISYLGRTMVAHGEDFDPSSEFGSCLVVLGRTDERLASAQERYVADSTAAWLESLDRNLAMMKEYQAARKKLENRRLAYDASISKSQKAKRDDFRIEEELRTNRAKYEESSEDVLRRMQDIKDVEADSVRDLTGFLDAQLDYHERCAEELRRLKRTWPAGGSSNNNNGGSGNYGSRSRSNTARSYNDMQQRPRIDQRSSSYNSIQNAAAASYADEEPEPLPRVPIRSNTRGSAAAAISPEKPPRPAVIRSSTYANGPDRPSRSGANTPVSYGASPIAAQAAASASSLRGGLRPVAPRIQTTNGYLNSNSSVYGSSYGNGSNLGDDGEDAASGVSGGGGSSPDWGERSTSPATSYGSLSRSTSNVAVNSTGRKPPPPPPVRSKKPPPPPIPAKREVGY